MPDMGQEGPSSKDADQESVLTLYQNREDMPEPASKKRRYDTSTPYAPLPAPKTNRMEREERQPEPEPHSDSGESTSGCSSLAPDSRNLERLRDFASSSFRDKSLKSPAHKSMLNESLSKYHFSLNSRNPSFNMDVFNNSTLLTKSKRMGNSPFYSARTIYGGSSSLVPYNRKLYGALGSESCSLGAFSLNRTSVGPSSRAGTSNVSLSPRDNVNMSASSRKILESLNFSSPVADAKRMIECEERMRGTKRKLQPLKTLSDCVARAADVTVAVKMQTANAAKKTPLMILPASPTPSEGDSSEDDASIDLEITQRIKDLKESINAPKEVRALPELKSPFSFTFSRPLKADEAKAISLFKMEGREAGGKVDSVQTSKKSCYSEEQMGKNEPIKADKCEETVEDDKAVQDDKKMGINVQNVSSKGGMFQPQVGWACDVSLLKNKEEDAACGAPRNNKRIEEGKTEIDTEQKKEVMFPSPSEMWKKFQPNAGSWKCPNCWISNDIGAKECVACKTEQVVKKTEETVKKKEEQVPKPAAFQFGIPCETKEVVSAAAVAKNVVQDDVKKSMLEVAPFSFGMSAVGSIDVKDSGARSFPCTSVSLTPSTTLDKAAPIGKCEMVNNLEKKEQQNQAELAFGQSNAVLGSDSQLMKMIGNSFGDKGGNNGPVETAKFGEKEAASNTFPVVKMAPPLSNTNNLFNNGGVEDRFKMPLAPAAAKKRPSDGFTLAVPNNVAEVKAAGPGSLGMPFQPPKVDYSKNNGQVKTFGSFNSQGQASVNLFAAGTNVMNFENPVVNFANSAPKIAFNANNSVSVPTFGAGMNTNPAVHKIGTSMFEQPKPTQEQHKSEFSFEGTGKSAGFSFGQTPRVATNFTNPIVSQPFSFGAVTVGNVIPSPSPFNATATPEVNNQWNPTQTSVPSLFNFTGGNTITEFTAQPSAAASGANTTLNPPQRKIKKAVRRL